MKNQQYFTKATVQQARILGDLRNAGGLTATTERDRLDMMHPAQRAKERGYNIIAHRATVDIEKGKHSVASYVLLSEGR